MGNAVMGFLGKRGPNNLRMLRKQLQVFGKEWFILTQGLVKGPILKVRTGNLLRSIKLHDGSKDPTAPFMAVSASAVSPKGFPYARYYEESERSYIAPAMEYIFNRNFPAFIRAYVHDGHLGFHEYFTAANLKVLRKYPALAKIHLGIFVDLTGGRQI